ncbi:MAG: hypothetical protein JF602_09895 [Gemmatimonadetes bacterium]|nr:hypothetical protein [Gemmatimonadota bacterium]
MQSRIVFNGKEYAGLEEMPEDVRKEFGARLAQLAADADGSGVPDVLEGKGNVAGLQTSISVNGRPVENLNDLPLPLRLLMGYAVRRVAATPLPQSQPAASAALLRRLDDTSNTLGTLLYGISARIGVVIALAWTVGCLIRLSLRRR